MGLYIICYVVIGVFVGLGMFSENSWRLDDTPRMHLFTMICGCLFLGIVWPITFMVRVLCFLNRIIP